MVPVSAPAAARRSPRVPATPPGRGITAAARRGSAPVRGFEDEHRDLAGGLLLVFGVGRVGGDRALPPLGPLVPRDLAGDHVPLAGTVLQLHERIRAEVVVPARVGGGPALRRDRGVTAVVLDPHHRRLAELAAARPAVGDDHYRQAGVPQGGALRPARALIQLDLLPDPGPAARLVLTFDGHGPSQHPGPAIRHAPPISTERMAAGCWCSKPGSAAGGEAPMRVSNNSGSFTPKPPVGLRGRPYPRRASFAAGTRAGSR